MLNTELRLHVDRHFHKPLASITLTRQRMAGLRLLAVQLAAGYETGNELLELREETGIATDTWSLLVQGKAELTAPQMKAVCRVLGVPAAYLDGTADYFGVPLEEKMLGKLHLPPWMMLRDERIISNSLLLRRMTMLRQGQLMLPEIAAMMNDRNLSEVKSMFSDLLGMMTVSGNASFYSPSAYQPVATRLEMLCLRYHLIHKHGVDAAACLPQLGSDFSDVEAVLEEKRRKRTQSEEASKAASERPPLDFLEERLKAMKAYNRIKAGGKLPPAWEVEAEALLQAVRDGKVKATANGRFAADRVSRKLNAVLKGRGRPLVLFVQDLLGEPYVAGILPAEGTLRNLLGMPRGTRFDRALELCTVVALAAKLQVGAVELVADNL